jgi:hypothetical protein
MLLRLPRPACRRQAGITLPGLLAAVILVVSGITLTLKLGPHYIDFRTMESVIEGLPREDVQKMSRAALNEMLDKRFRINNLRDFVIRDIIVLERSRDATWLIVNYERREKLFLNVDVVVSFNKRFDFS